MHVLFAVWFASGGISLWFRLILFLGSCSASNFGAEENASTSQCTGTLIIPSIIAPPPLWKSNTLQWTETREWMGSYLFPLCSYSHFWPYSWSFLCCFVFKSPFQFVIFQVQFVQNSHYAADLSVCWRNGIELNQIRCVPFQTIAPE